MLKESWRVESYVKISVMCGRDESGFSTVVVILVIKHMCSSKLYVHPFCIVAIIHQLKVFKWLSI